MARIGPARELACDEHGCGGRQAMIALRYFQPAPDLRRYVSSYYLFSADLPQVSDIVRAELGQIRFMLSGQGCYTFGDGEVLGSPAVALLGPTMAASRFDVTGPVLVFGVGLLPTGWAAGIREDASRLVDQVDDAAARLGGLLDDALDALRAAPGAESMVAIADVVMRAVFARAIEPPLWFTRLTESWLTETASPAIDGLVEAAGLSARQLARLTNRIYGAPPKLLFDARADWATAAGEAFYDQSHFIRELKLFTGLTPSQLRAGPPPVTKLISQRRGFAAQMPKIAMVR